MEAKYIETVKPRLLIYQSYDANIMLDYLQASGFKVAEATPDNILSKIREGAFDLCLLDHLDSKDRLGHLKYLRKLSHKIPAIVVSDDMSYAGIIEAFDEGADDYVVKPYNIEELIRRIKAVLKRCGVRLRNIEPVYVLGKYVFEVETNTLTYRAEFSIDNVVTKLSKKQTEILSILCAYKGEIVQKEILLQQLWEEDNYFVKRSFDVHICALRRFLKLDPTVAIKTIHRTGYSLIVEEQENS